DAHRARHGAQGRHALFHDARALAHFLDAHQIAGEAVAGLADRNVELHAIVDVVGLSLAQIPRNARGADHRAAETPIDRLLRRPHADIDRAHAEDAVVVQQLLDVLDEGMELLDPGVDRTEHAGRQILVHAAGTEIGRVHARAADALVKLH